MRRDRGLGLLLDRRDGLARRRGNADSASIAAFLAVRRRAGGPSSGSSASTAGRALADTGGAPSPKSSMAAQNAASGRCGKTSGVRLGAAASGAGTAMIVSRGDWAGSAGSFGRSATSGVRVNRTSGGSVNGRFPANRGGIGDRDARYPGRTGLHRSSSRGWLRQRRRRVGLRLVLVPHIVAARWQDATDDEPVLRRNQIGAAALGMHGHGMVGDCRKGESEVHQMRGVGLRER